MSLAVAVLTAATLAGCSTAAHRTKNTNTPAHVPAKSPNPIVGMRDLTQPVQTVTVTREPATRAPGAPIRVQEPPASPASLADAMFAAGATQEPGPTFVFQKKGAPPSGPSPSLYEDAITQGKLRARLKAVWGLPPAVASHAAVADGCALISAPPSCPPAPLVAAAHAALDVGGIRAARVAVR